MVALSAFPWTSTWPLFAKYAGRKLPLIVASVTVGVTFVTLYFSEKVYQIVIAELLQGCLHAGNITVTILVVTEYCSVKYRGIFLTIKSASFFWGIWVANAIGTFYHWKYIALLGFLCTVYTFNVFFWPESPFWLASKGRFDECRNSFRWIHGVNKESERDLNELISTQDERIKLAKEGGDVGCCEMFRCTEFYKPVILCVMAILQYQFSGKLMFSVYILEIFKNITTDEGSAYTAMLVLDGVTVVGMYIGAFMAKGLNRRTLYFSSSFTGVAFLFITSLYLFLIRLTVFDENKYATLVLLAVYSISISCGPIILSMTICGEIISTKFQAASYLITALTLVISNLLLSLLSPLIFSTFGVDGAFLFFGVTCGLCTIYLYLYLPETRNKTQLEIELFFKDEKKDSEDQTVNGLKF